MNTPVLNNHVVGLRELRHHTGEVLARVRHGETVDITEYGRLIARIVPVEERTPSSVMTQLVRSGRAKLALRPGFRPKMRSGGEIDELSRALKALRDEESW